MMKTRETNLDNLLEAFDERNENEFKYLLKNYVIDINQPCDGVTILEKILQTPKSSNYAEICIQYGANISKKNQKGQNPIHFAIKSLCADNLKTLMTHYTQSNNDLIYFIINATDERKNNYLHLIIDRMTCNTFNDCYVMIEILLLYNCNPNHLNDQRYTPFEMLLRKVNENENSNELVRLFLEKSRFGVELHRDENLIQIATDLNILDKVLIRDVINEKYLIDKLVARNEDEFMSGLEILKRQQVIGTNYLVFLEEAIISGSVMCVNALIENVLNINESIFMTMPPLFLALSHGRHEIVKIFLKFDNLSFTMSSKSWNVLHEICSSKNPDNHHDMQLCFNQIIKDRRCTVDIINQLDHKQYTPLMYACKNEYDEIATELLKRGAYAGHEFITQNIKEKILSECLDDCMTHCGDVNDKNLTVQMNYRFLIPPAMSRSSNNDMRALKLLTTNKSLMKKINHPLIETYINLKWNRVRFFIYTGLLIYFIFLVFLSQFILEFFRSEVYNQSLKNLTGNDRNFSIDVRIEEDEPAETTNIKSTLSSWEILKIVLGRKKRDVSNIPPEVKPEDYINEHLFGYQICLFGIFLMTIYEVVELAVSWKWYFFKLSNWIDCTLLGLSYAVFLHSFGFDTDTFRKMRAVLFLIIASQSIIIVAKVSSLSLHLEIFKKACKTFMKFLMLYSILILAFAMSYCTLYDDEKKENKSDDDDSDQRKAFEGFLISVVTVFRMMLSDFEHMKINPDDHFNALLFLTFMLLITVILFNLLNALAVNDTREILEHAEIMNIRKRIKMIYRLELFLTRIRFNCYNISSLIPSGYIVIMPNIDNLVRFRNCGKYEEAKITHSLPFQKNFIQIPLKIDNELVLKAKDYIRGIQDEK